MTFLQKLFLCNFFIFCLTWIFLAKENTEGLQYAIIAGSANLVAFFVVTWVIKWKHRAIKKR